MTLYRKYRPQTWADLAAQAHVKASLGEQVKGGHIAHAYLFSGPRGVGKTTVARLFARAISCGNRQADSAEPCGECVNCQAMLNGNTLDLIEIDAASNRGIDTVREVVIEAARFAPAQLPYKTFIIDEVHMLTTEAFNALLKTLEEPPAKVVFILATTELHKVPATIISRCQRFDFRTIPPAEMVERLRVLAKKENVQVEIKTLDDVARASGGCLRDAESLLGQLLGAAREGVLHVEDAALLLPRNDAALAATFCAASLDNQPTEAFAVLARLQEDGGDAESFADEACAFLRQAILQRLGAPEAGANYGEDLRGQLVALAGRHSAERIAMFLELLLEKRRQVSLSPLPFLPLELAVARFCVDATAVVAPLAVPVVKPVAATIAKPAAAVVAAVKPVEPVPSEAEVVVAVEDLFVAPAKVKPEPVVVAAQPVSSVSPEAGEPVTTIEAVFAKWTAFMAHIGQNQPSLTFILADARPVAVRGKIVDIGFGFSFHRDKCNDGKNRVALDKSLSAVLGVEVIVEGTLLEKKAEVGHTDPVPMASASAGGSSTMDALNNAFGKSG